MVKKLPDKPREASPESKKGSNTVKLPETDTTSMRERSARAARHVTGEMAALKAEIAARRGSRTSTDVKGSDSDEPTTIVTDKITQPTTKTTESKARVAAEKETNPTEQTPQRATRANVKADVEVKAFEQVVVRPTRSKVVAEVETKVAEKVGQGSFKVKVVGEAETKVVEPIAQRSTRGRVAVEVEAKPVEQPVQLSSSVKAITSLAGKAMAEHKITNVEDQQPEDRVMRVKMMTRNTKAAEIIASVAKEDEEQIADDETAQGMTSGDEDGKNEENEPLVREVTDDEECRVNDILQIKLENIPDESQTGDEDAPLEEGEVRTVRLKNETAEEHAARMRNEYRRQRNRINILEKDRMVRRKALAEKIALRNATETPEEREARIARRVAQEERRLARETPEQRAARLRAKSEREARRRANETPEERAARLRLDSARSSQRRKELDEAARAAKLKVRAEWKARRLANMTIEERIEQKYKAQLKRLSKQEMETPEERAEKNRAKALRKAKLEAEMTEEQKAEARRAHEAMIKQRQADRAFLCMTCGKRFTTPSALYGHENNWCQNQFVSDEEEDDKPLVSIVKGKKLGLSGVGVAGRPVQLRLKRRRKRSVNLYVCKVCRRAFRSTAWLVKHYKSHIGDANPNKITYTCGICNLRYLSAQTLKRHVKQNHHDPEDPNAPPVQYICHICNLRYQHEQSLKRHQKLQHSGGFGLERGRLSFMCAICRMKYLNPQSLTRHIKLKHPQAERPYLCQGCGMHFKQPQHLRHHELQLCPNRVMPETVGDIVPADAFIQEAIVSESGRTPRGQRKVHQPMIIDAHMTLAGGMRKRAKARGDSEVPDNVCNECGKTFMRFHWYRKHLQTHYSEEQRDHVCPECGKAFIRPHWLQKHIDGGLCDGVVGAGDVYVQGVAGGSDHREHICGGCGKVFIRIHWLQKHLDMGQCEGAADVYDIDDCYICAVCESKFTDIAELEQHVESHYSDQTGVDENYPQIEVDDPENVGIICVYPKMEIVEASSTEAAALQMHQDTQVQ